MKSIIRLSSLFLVILSIIICTGCGTDYREAYIYFELNARPDTLDAQTAKTDCEVMIVRNIYEGLLRKNESGAISCGVAESYEKNGLTYTFHLRKDARWSNGTPLTADDFVFAMKRAVLSETDAPFANRLFSIVNAENIYKGKIDISQLGVSASDAHTLIITLQYDDENFEETLTSSICMPCNEDFFYSSLGKYGLTNNTTISNGSYSLRKWDKENFGIRLYRNKEYVGAFEARNAAVFLSNREDESPIELLERGSIDAAFLENTQVQTAKNLGMTVFEYQNTCWFLTLGTEYSDAVRQCFAAAFSTDVYRDALPYGFEATSSIYPDIFKFEGTEGVGLTNYNIDWAKQRFSALVAQMESKRFPSATLYYYNSSDIQEIVTDIVGHWQQNLSAFINIQASSSLDNLISQLKNQTLSFAVFPVKITSSSLSEYMLNFNVTGNDATSLQETILSGNRIIPIAFENTAIACSDTLEQFISEEENGYIDFSYIIKNS